MKLVNTFYKIFYNHFNFFGITLLLRFEKNSNK